MASAIANVIFALTFVLAILYVWLLWPRSRERAMSFARLQHGGPLRATGIVARPCASSSCGRRRRSLWLILSSVLEQQALIAQPPDLSPGSLHARQFRAGDRRRRRRSGAASSIR